MLMIISMTILTRYHHLSGPPFGICQYNDNHSTLRIQRDLFIKGEREPRPYTFETLAKMVGPVFTGGGSFKNSEKSPGDNA